MTLTLTQKFINSTKTQIKECPCCRRGVTGLKDTHSEVHLNEINNPQVYAKFTLPEDGSYQTITSSVQPSHLPIPTQFVVRSDDESEQETFRNPLGWFHPLKVQCLNRFVSPIYRWTPTDEQILRLKVPGNTSYTTAGGFLVGPCFFSFSFYRWNIVLQLSIILQHLYHPVIAKHSRFYFPFNQCGRYSRHISLRPTFLCQKTRDKKYWDQMFVGSFFPRWTTCQNGTLCR